MSTFLTAAARWPQADRLSPRRLFGSRKCAAAGCDWPLAMSPIKRLHEPPFTTNTAPTRSPTSQLWRNEAPDRDVAQRAGRRGNRSDSTERTPATDRCRQPAAWAPLRRPCQRSRPCGSLWRWRTRCGSSQARSGPANSSGSGTQTTKRVCTFSPITEGIGCKDGRSWPPAQASSSVPSSQRPMRRDAG